MAENLNMPDLPKFLRILDVIVRELPREVDTASKDVARQWIAAARNRASRPMARDAAQTLSTSPTTDGGTFIKATHPGFFGEEFGGRGRPETMMFPPHQGKRGYWFFPAARANVSRFNAIWESAVDEATRDWKN